jgi:hypothetical protein
MTASSAEIKKAYHKVIIFLHAIFFSFAPSSDCSLIIFSTDGSQVSPRQKLRGRCC